MGMNGYYFLYRDSEDTWPGSLLLLELPTTYGPLLCLDILGVLAELVEMKSCPTHVLFVSWPPFDLTRSCVRLKGLAILVMQWMLNSTQVKAGIHS